VTATILPLGGDGAAERAYDALAGGYEAAIAEDAWMRRVLHRHHARRFAPGDRVLDAACGTGLDSLALARRGVQVTAVDVSAGMLAVLARRQAAAGGPAIDVRRADLAELAGWPAARFDGIVSSFAGINATDPAAFAAVARRLLVPGGRMVLHLLAPAGAGGGRDGDEERTFVLAGTPVRHWTLPARQAYRRVFATGFRLCGAYALGFLLPRRCGRWLPSSLAGGLGRLEERLGSRRPFLERGRFAVLDLERTS
jgi:ubiquinone/menaquinone biosynthesis C-methylase UbiE